MPRSGALGSDGAEGAVPHVARHAHGCRPMADAHFPNPILQEAARKSEERAGLTTQHADLLELYRALFISNILVIAPNMPLHGESTGAVPTHCSSEHGNAGLC